MGGGGKSEKYLKLSLLSQKIQKSLQILRRPKRKFSQSFGWACKKDLGMAKSCREKKRIGKKKRKDLGAARFWKMSRGSKRKAGKRLGLKKYPSPTRHDVNCNNKIMR